jgi:hypothetical protein
MALTMPKASQINFDLTNISDPIIRLNSGESGSADKDVGIVIERGDDTNTAIIYDESANEFAVINTTETGSTSGNVTIASYADIRAGTFYGDGSGLTGVTSYTDSDVASYLSSNTIATSNINVSGDVLPDADNTRSLGSASLQWQEVYIGPGSLYVNGKKVLEESAGTIVVSADADQSLTVKTTGTGVLTLQSATTVNVAGTLQIQSGNSITDSAGTAVAFGDPLDMNSNKITELGTPSASTDAATKGYVDTTVGDYLPLTGGTISSNLTVSGNFTVNGTTTTINTSTLSVADNLIDLNSDVTSGTPSQDAGIRILRGDSNAVQLRWNETNDKWELTTDGASYTNIAVTSDIPTAVSELTNDSGYITGYTVTQGDVTAHQASLSITESQISDLQSYLTAETNDLTAVVTWANVPDANITQSSVTQHQAALSITESQISDLGTYLTASDITGKLNLSGGTMSGAIAMGTNKITGMGDPAAAQDAATKAYVDSQVSSVPTGDITAVNITAGTGLSGTVSTASGDHTQTLSIDSTVATLTGTQTLTNKTITSPTISNPTLTGTYTFTSDATSTPAMTLTANSINDGVGALRINGSQADIFLNPSTATHTTITFAVNDDQRLAFGMDNNSDFYITRRTSSTWYDDTFVLDRDTGLLSLGYGATVAGTLTYSTLNDGTTALSSTVAELNYVDGVTSNIQTQIDAKTNNTGTVTSVAGTGTVNGLTLSGTVTSSGSLTLGGTFSATVSEISDLTATAAELNVLDGIPGTLTATELGYVDGVTSAIQTQIDAKAPLAAPAFTGTATGVNLTLSGDLTVNGTTTTVNTTNLVVSDNLIELNNGAASNANDSGIVIERGSTGDNAFIGWDESADKFIVGTTTATGASTGNLSISTGTLVANLEGDVTGNADTATALATARNIAGQSFDGTGNISIASTDLSDTASIVLTTASQTLTNKTLTSPALTTPTVTTAITLNAQADLRFADADSSNWLAFQAPNTVGSNVTWTLPATDGTEDQVLSTNGSGSLAWADAGSGGSSSASSYPNSTVSTMPGSAGDYDLGKNTAQDTAESPFEAGGADAFGVNLGTVYSMMDPAGTTTTVDLGAFT